jgi:hypothetical protein
MQHARHSTDGRHWDCAMTVAGVHAHARRPKAVTGSDIAHHNLLY